MTNCATILRTPASMSDAPTAILPYYDIQSWALTQQSVNEYSKIFEANHIFGYKEDIKHNEKLLLLDFMVLKDFKLSGDKIIANDLRIIRTVKDGTIFCKNPAYIYVESSERTDGMMTKRITPHSYLAPNGLIIDSPLYERFESFPTVNRQTSVYMARLHSDELLNDIRAKKQRRSPIKPVRHLPCLFQLCVYAIATNDLPQYNNMNRKMQLALK